MLEKPPIGDPCNGCGLCCQIQVCSAGSFSMGLVDAYGDRAPGPCPALVSQPDGSFACGMVLRPKEYAPAGKGGAHDLRKAVQVLIGAGAGCDEAGDEPAAKADRKIAEIQQRYLARHGRDGINRAVAKWFGLD